MFVVYIPSYLKIIDFCYAVGQLFKYAMPELSEIVEAESSLSLISCVESRKIAINNKINLFIYLINFYKNLDT